jgi:plastocyanin
VKKAATIFAAGAIAAFGVAACGSSDDNSSDSTASGGTSSAADTTAAATNQTVTVDTDPSGKLAFTTTDVKAKAGTATIELNNQAPVSHDLVVQSSDGSEVGRTDIISQSTADFNADLKPGTYKFFCDLPGHEATMHGTITVK